MLRYYYVKQKDRLHVYDSENGFYKSFDREGKKWVTPIVSFSQVERDNDIDFVEISKDIAREISDGVNFDCDLKNYISLICNP